MMERLRFVLATAMALALVGPTAPALADPGKSKSASSFQLVCDGELSTLTVGGGPWTAAHVAESGRTFVPTSTHLFLRDPVTLEVVYEEHDWKGKARPGETLCVEEFLMDGLSVAFHVRGHMR